jgi:hypothetical protein
MALITCAECGHKISDQATSCPSCGAPQKPVGASPVDPVQYPNRLNDFFYRVEKDKSISAVNSRGLYRQLAFAVVVAAVATPLLSLPSQCAARQRVQPAAHAIEPIRRPDRDRWGFSMRRSSLSTGTRSMGGPRMITLQLLRLSSRVAVRCFGPIGRRARGAPCTSP